MERNYVIASTKHMTNGFLEFWGRHTQDNEERSQSGYYRDLDICEKYTKEELIATKRCFPFYRKGMRQFQHEHFFIKVSDLENIGKKMTVIYM